MIHSSNTRFIVEFTTAANSTRPSVCYADEIPTWRIVARELRCSEGRAREIVKELTEALELPKLAVFHRRMRNNEIIDVRVEGWCDRVNDITYSTSTKLISRKP